MFTPQSHPDIKWVENAKTLFKVRIHVASTIYAQVQQVYYFSSNTDVDIQQGCPNAAPGAPGEPGLWEKACSKEQQKGNWSVFFCLVGQKTRSDVNPKTGFGQRITWFNDTERVLLWCNDDDEMCLPQDLYLHKFFQHCQLMTSEGNPAELIRYLKVPFLLIL